MSLYDTLGKLKCDVKLTVSVITLGLFENDMVQLLTQIVADKESIVVELQLHMTIGQTTVYAGHRL